MKQSWTRFARFYSGKVPERWLRSAFNSAFLKHHKNAQEIILDSKNGDPLAAIYCTPEGEHHEFVKKVMTRIQYAYLEADDDCH